jgi:hypothetical protein
VLHHRSLSECAETSGIKKEAAFTGQLLLFLIKLALADCHLPFIFSLRFLEPVLVLALEPV